MAGNRKNKEEISENAGLSLFGTEEDNGLFAPDEKIESGTETESTSADKNLDIVKFQANGLESVSDPMSLFAGFKTLKVITFSSGETMIRKMARLFDSVEIIFGNESVLGGIKEKIIEQYAIIRNVQAENTKSKNFLFNQIADGKLSFYVTKLNDHTSHQKIYLLSDDENGKYRVITGSANFSLTAFGGRQLETICVADDFRTYDIYRDLYEKTKQLSTQHIDAETVRELDLEHLDALPAVREVKKVKCLLVEEAPRNRTVDAYYIQSEKFNDFLKENKIDLDELPIRKNGASLILYEDIKKLTSDAKTAFTKKEEVLKVYPQFYFDVEKSTVFYNDEPMDLDNISEADVASDVALFKNFFEGYFDPESEFCGDIINGVRKYYATVVYAFSAPFLSVTRARCPAYVEVINYPMFLLLHGITNAGKTFLTRFILHTMFNEYHVNVSGRNGLIQTAHAEDNAPTKLQKKIRLCKGTPLIVDELSNDRWKKYGETFIKTDYTYEEHLSPVIFTTNDVSQIDEALNKRAVAFDINIKTERISNLKNNMRMKSLQNMTGALYKLYLRKMLEAYPKFLDALHDESRKYAPDIFALSSGILKDIFQKFGYTDERYVDIYTVLYYMTSANEEENIKDFVELYKKDHESWIIDRKHNFLRINFESKWDARDFQRKYGSRLVQWNKGPYITMEIDKTESYFDIKINSPGFLQRIFKVH